MQRASPGAGRGAAAIAAAISGSSAPGPDSSRVSATLTGTQTSSQMPKSRAAVSETGASGAFGVICSGRTSVS
ncbi:hypothetical protein ACTTAM_17275 [Rhodobacter capsulatus]|uniref:hypothetical protein n=1 Tax=Rhodobacter capsulatus TaxID=1061 RepID=UPI0040263A46